MVWCAALCSPPCCSSTAVQRTLDATVHAAPHHRPCPAAGRPAAPTASPWLSNGSATHPPATASSGSSAGSRGPSRSLPHPSPVPPALLLPQSAAAAAAAAAAPAPTTQPLEQSMARLGLLPDDEDDESYVCVVCMEAPRSTVLVPCGHMALCIACCERIIVQSADKLCPMCCQTVLEHVVVIDE